MFSSHNRMELEINNRKKFGKFTNMQKLSNILLINQWVKEEITRKRITKKNKNSDLKLEDNLR